MKQPMIAGNASPIYSLCHIMSCSDLARRDIGLCHPHPERNKDWEETGGSGGEAEKEREREREVNWKLGILSTYTMQEAPSLIYEVQYLPYRLHTT